MKTIEYKVSFEKMISRIPGLFAYLDWDEYGEASLHKATDSLDGCWGRVVENIKLPSGVSLNNELISGNVYSFRTIIDYYYQYKDILGKNDPFIVFVENGIGKILVPEKAMIDGVELKVKGKATPKYIYLSNVKRLYNELVKMQKTCDFYDEIKNKGIIDEDEHLCCICEKYKNLGGAAFKGYVGGLIPEAERRATLFFGYAKDAQDIEKEMTIDFDIDLVSTYQDFGIMTPYAPTWLPYKRYKVGDEVEYDGELYRCKRENTGKWDEDLLTVVFDYDKFAKVSAKFIDMSCGEETYLENNECNFEKKTIHSVGETWYDGEAIKHMAMKRNIGEEIRDYDVELTFPIKIEGRTDSKLSDLRRFKTYYNDDGVAERPVIGEDWLFYYRVGDVVNIQTINDNLGNVADKSIFEVTGQVQACSETDKHLLMAYGDVIEKITYDVTKHTITFTYRVGVHLKSNENGIVTYDDDNNKLIKWEKFVWDGNSEIGIKYTETYNYEEGSDLDKLIGGNITMARTDETQTPSTFTFANYIIGEYDEMIPTYKFEFSTINNTFNYDKTIAHQDVNIVSLLTDYEAYKLNFDEFTESKLFREDYFNGISYKPTKNIDVHIERGSTSVFDKHIAFGEIKTMDDLITYKNGSFFPITES